MPRYCQVNATDYDGDVVVEVVNINGRAVDPHVPAWEEQGHGDLAGPFANEAEAFAALCREADYGDGVAVYYMPERDCPAFD